MKMVKLKKDKDRVEIRNASGELVADIEIAKSSHTSNINLAIKPANQNISIARVPQN